MLYGSVCEVRVYTLAGLTGCAGQLPEVTLFPGLKCNENNSPTTYSTVAFRGNTGASDDSNVAQSK